MPAYHRLHERISVLSTQPTTIHPSVSLGPDLPGGARRVPLRSVVRLRCVARGPVPPTSRPPTSPPPRCGAPTAPLPLLLCGTPGDSHFSADAVSVRRAAALSSHECRRRRHRDDLCAAINLSRQCRQCGWCGHCRRVLGLPSRAARGLGQAACGLWSQWRQWRRASPTSRPSERPSGLSNRPACTASARPSGGRPSSRPRRRRAPHGPTMAGSSARRRRRLLRPDANQL